jgi:multidrug resistance efflux pump
MYVVLSSTGTFAEIRPAMHATLGSLAAFFEGELPPALPPPSGVEAAGRITALDEFSISATHTARITAIPVQKGQSVKQGSIIARLDDSEAKAALKATETTLVSARYALAQAQKGEAPPPPTTLAREPFDAGFTALSNTFINLDWIIPAHQDVLNGDQVNPGVQPNMFAYADLVDTGYPDIVGMREAADRLYRDARTSYASSRQQYQGLSNSSSENAIELGLQATYETLKKESDALKSVAEFLAKVRERVADQGGDVPEALAGHMDQVADAAQTVNDNLESLRNAQDRINEARAAAGAPAPTEKPDTYSLQLAVTAAENDLALTERSLEDYVLRAPVSGQIASVDMRVGERALDGEVIATLVSPQVVARVALSEADALKVRVLQKVDLSFDGAGFSLEGTVADIDTRATVEDDTVVFYALIAFPEDPRAKAGMTVTAHFK